MGKLSFLQRLDDSYLISPKLIYFFICTVYYALYLFRAQFMKEYLRLDLGQYGDISAMMALVSFAFMTLWSSFADHIGRHRLILVALCLALAGSMELSLFVGPIENSSVRFYLAAAVLSLYSFFACGILPLTDYLILKMLSDRPGFSRDLYGRQRLWGTVSYGLTSLVVSFFTQNYDVVSIFYIVPISSLVSAAIVLFLGPTDSPTPLRHIFSLHKAKLPPSDDTLAEQDGLNKQQDMVQVQAGKGEEETGQDELEKEQNIDGAPEQQGSTKRRPIFVLLTNSNYIFMLFVVFMTGSARAVMTTFLSAYWSDYMHLKKTQVGIAANFGILMEIVIFFFGKFFIRTCGIYWMLIFSQLAMVVRCWAYVFLPPSSSNFWVVYVIELLKGVAFGFTQSAGVKLASEIAPPGLEATAQALYTSVYSQLPAVLTAFAGGRCTKAYGPVMLFYITSVISTAALALFLLKYSMDGSIRLPLFQQCRKKGDTVEMSAP